MPREEVDFQPEVTEEQCERYYNLADELRDMFAGETIDDCMMAVALFVADTVLENSDNSSQAVLDAENLGNAIREMIVGASGS